MIDLYFKISLGLLLEMIGEGKSIRHTAMQVLGILFLVCNPGFAGQPEMRPPSGSTRSPDLQVCNLKREIENKRGETRSYYECPDGSFSFPQPSGNASRDGLCGATTAVSLLTLFCGPRSTVEDFDSEFINFFLNWKPPEGSSLQMVRSGLNKAWEKHCHHDSLLKEFEWKLSYRDGPIDYLKHLYESINARGLPSLWRRRVSDERSRKKHPLATSIHFVPRTRADDPFLHFVEVVDIETDKNLSQLLKASGNLESLLDGTPCKVIFNSWGEQFAADCVDFTYWASMPKIPFAIRHFSQFGIIELVRK